MTTIHPIFVHFPIALLLTATLISVLAVLFKNKREELKIVLYWILILGAISVLAALFSGLYEDERVVHDEAIHKIMEVHKLLGFIITTVFVLITIWFIIRKRKIRLRELTVMTLLLIGTSGVLVYSAYLGGEMVYEQGAGVKPMEKYMLEMHNGEGQHSHGGEAMQPGEMMEHTHAGTEAGHQEMEKDSSAHQADSATKKKIEHNADGHSHGDHTH
jgi:uncharacterized membrane protein